MVTVRLDPGDIGRTTMKVDIYLLGHWPSEQERLHIGGGRARRIQSQGPKHRAELVRRKPGWRAAGTSGPPAASDVLSVAVFSIECSELAQRYA